MTTTTETVVRGPRATVRHYLMCPPTHFAVDYAINPWMRPDLPVDAALALRQWRVLRDTYLDLGHQVDTIEPVVGLPDMVFAANGALAFGGRVLGARFCHPERAGEAPAYRAWFSAHGFTDVRETTATSEGEGDFLVVGDRILAGTGFRTGAAAHDEANELFGLEVTTLHLVDARFYHLDTALAVLDERTIAYYPSAFTDESGKMLRRLFPDAVVATEDDALALGLNAVSDGEHVVLGAEATGLAATLRDRGYAPVPVDLSELRKAGGGAKCCTLELHR